MRFKCTTLDVLLQKLTYEQKIVYNASLFTLENQNNDKNNRAKDGLRKHLRLLSKAAAFLSYHLVLLV